MMALRIAGVLLILLGTLIAGLATYGFYLTHEMASLLALARASDHGFDPSAWAIAWRVSSTVHFIAGLGLVYAGVLSWRGQARALVIICGLALFEAIFPWLQPQDLNFPFAARNVFDSAILVGLAIAAAGMFARKRHGAGT